MYRADPDAIVVLKVFGKKTPQTPRTVIEACKRHLREYDQLVSAKRGSDEEK